MLITRAEINGDYPVDLRCEEGFITEIGTCLSGRKGELILNAQAGTLLPGLHDHHIHLYALAAIKNSIFCGPPQINNLDELVQVLRHAPGETGWVRGTGYHDSVAGSLDRWQLDRLVTDRPIRIQHRSGKMWILNSAAVDLLGLDKQNELETIELGIERNERGLATGRLFRLDSWLGEKLKNSIPPNLSDISMQLARAGVTGVTDASPTNSAQFLRQLTEAIEKKQLLQRVLVMGDILLPDTDHPLIKRGALKILLDEHQLPPFDQLTTIIAGAHCKKRVVAIHCVTQTELIFALSALMEAGSESGDRIEHASITPDSALDLLHKTGVTVVTQPGFIKERGDQYLTTVDRIDHPLLYRCRTLIEAGIPIGGSTDAPYGSPDPWTAIAAAVQRQTHTGQTIGEREKLTPEQALALFTSDPESPGGVARPISQGAPADFCLLDRPWSEARKRLTADDVAATIRAGELIYKKNNIKAPPLLRQYEGS